MTFRASPHAVVVGAVTLLLAAARPAAAAGLYIGDRGVVPLSRAGAFVAGADDLGAIVYNPAGIYDAGSQFLLDANFVLYSADYTRIANLYQRDPNTGKDLGQTTQTFPTVHPSVSPIPIPTLTASFQVHKQLVLALGVWAPNAAITTYPSTVNGAGAPQRYSLLSLDGSALAVVGGWASFAPSKEWRIGAGFEVLAGTFQSTVDFGGCLQDRFFCAPEDKAWDVLSQVKVGPIVAPSGNFGVMYAPTPNWKIGASFQLPFYVRASGTITTQLPASPVFDRASQVGNAADIAFDLPWQLRAGVERRFDDLKLELGFGYDKWSMQDTITVTPKNVSLQNIAGFPQSYSPPPVTFARNFQDSWSVRLGGDYGKKIFEEQHASRAGDEPVRASKLHVRGGVSFESSAVPTNSMSVLTIDGPKVTLGLGLGLQLRKVRLDVTYAHIFIVSSDVDPATGALTQQSPVLANPPQHPDVINGGHYSSSANILGLGFTYTFSEPPAEFVSSEAPPVVAPKTEAPTAATPAVEPPVAAAPEVAPVAEEAPAAAPPPDPPKKKGKGKKKKKGGDDPNQ